ncbi:MAG TPA: winged helix-turn-helix domain-containing protein [Solirubrobacterales bacterium]|nr:winged helix-turn-helix domain-containing protein [Solirubrobacterales bacterium]
MGAKIVDESMFTGVLAHPIRCRALTILADREASPVEIGRELGIGASHVAYHVRLLHEHGLIELTDETPRRGAIEHRYRAVSFAHSDEEFAKLSEEERASFSRLIFCHAAAEASCAFSAGTYARRPDHHISHLPVQVDEEGWGELRDLYWNHLQEIQRIKREAGERLAEAGKKGTPVLTFNTFFELPEERVAPRTFHRLPPS